VLKSSPGEFATTISQQPRRGGHHHLEQSHRQRHRRHHTVATLGDVQTISYSSSSVYVRSPDFSSSVMGPGT